MSFGISEAKRDLIEQVSHQYPNMQALPAADQDADNVYRRRQRNATVNLDVQRSSDPVVKHPRHEPQRRLQIEVAAEDRRFRVFWALAWPLRMYVRHTPIERGRKFLMWRVLKALVPPGDRTFLAHSPGGGRIRLRYREVIGFLRLVQGRFESAEVETLMDAARPGTVAVDIGANVGIFTVPLARAVGTDGAVWAFEPLPENVGRLHANVSENQLSNVRLFAAAASETDGALSFSIASDSAYGSTRVVFSGRATGTSLTVPAVRLDTEWRRLGMPFVSVIKIDVEGAELAVLRGSEGVIRHCRPVLLLEAADSDELAEIEKYLSPFNYERRLRPRFVEHNHLFLPL
jgi:FkbM family methyltransferase